jgi:hypothetical protein
MRALSDDGRRIVQDLARRHGVSAVAVETLLQALAAGGGTQAQFDHPELGGLGQWSSGGMLMIGDMLNAALKARIAGLAADLADRLRQGGLFAPEPDAGSGRVAGGRWPAELGDPASAGAQDGLRYAVFPAARRLAVERDGRVTVYDTADHRIGGVSQQQGAGSSLTFASQNGAVSLADLKIVSAPPDRRGPAPTGSSDDDRHADVFAKIERLHELRLRGVLTAQEFEAKKAELLARL